MNKYILLITGLLISAAGFCQTKGYVVKFRLDQPDKYKPVLSYYQPDLGKAFFDSSFTLENGWAVFKGVAKEPVLASISIRHADRNAPTKPGVQFFLTNEKIDIEGDMDMMHKAKVSGGKINQEWESIKYKQQEFRYDRFIALQISSKSEKDTVLRNLLMKLYFSLMREEKYLVRDYIKENPASFVGIHFLSQLYPLMEPQEIIDTYAFMEPFKNPNEDIWKTSTALNLDSRVKALRATAIGKEAVPINKRDINGKEVNLKTLKGKYVLLDFWGSWCGPCRGSHPHLKELYAKYRDKGFEIVGISQEDPKGSLDGAKAAWQGAIKKDGIGHWIHVLNNDGVQEFDAVKAYGISAFPTKLILDKEGRIIFRQIGEEPEPLDQKLKEIFGQ